MGGKNDHSIIIIRGGSAGRCAGHKGERVYKNGRVSKSEGRGVSRNIKRKKKSFVFRFSFRLYV